MATKIKPSGKFAIILIVLALATGGLYFSGNLDMKSIFPSDSASDEAKESLKGVSSDVKTYTVAVNTWGGFASGLYFNRGLHANTNSQFYKDYGFLVDFKLIDDFNASREAWKTGDVDVLFAITGSFTTEVNGLAEYEPQIIFQTDWSRGGDAIVVRQGIDKVNDLKGKTIAVALLTPSHTFFLNLLEAGELNESDVTIIEAPSAIDAANMFRAGQVDAAIVWSPDDIKSLNEVKGSKVLQSTKQASAIIADVFVVKKAFLNKNESDLTKLVEGWLKGAAEINSNPSAKNLAVEILAKGMNLSPEESLGAIDNTRLTTYGDNVNFFGLNPSFNGVTGEKLYTKMAQKYKDAGYLNGSTYWRNVGNPSIIKNISLVGQEHLAEGSVTFTAPTVAMADTHKTIAMSTKQVSITYGIGSYELSGDAKYTISKEFSDIIKFNGNNRIRIVGNTDITGNYNNNKKLSFLRAQSVANFIATEYGVDKNRIVVVGNGSDNPIADNNTQEGRAKNRRTDMELMSN